MPTCGGNFSFVVDYGGQDKYGCEAGNNVYLQRGGFGGFLIDRPSRAELEAKRKKEADEEDSQTAEKPTEQTRS